MQFSRVQRLLIMKAITPEQWTKLVSELFSRNPTLLKATAALTKISANAKDPKDHLAWRVASLSTKSASPSQKSPSPSSAKSVQSGQTRPPSLTSVTPTNGGGVQSLSPFVPQRSLPNSAARQPPRRKIMAWQDTRSVSN